MQDLNPPAIVQPSQNGLEYLRLLCELFNIDMSAIPAELQPEALQLLAGLYAIPAAKTRDLQAKALEELDDLQAEYFPMNEPDGVWDAIKSGIQIGLAWEYSGFGAQHKHVQMAYWQVRTEMIFKRNKWRNLTMGSPDDLVTGYRYRRMMTSVFEAAVAVAGISVLSGDVAAPVASSIGKGLESYSTDRSIRNAARSGLTRLRSGGSGPIQAITKGRGVSALASRGGAAGLLGVYTLAYIYAGVKDEEDEIRAAIALRVLNGKFEESYLDEVNRGLGVYLDVSREWFE